MRNASADRDLSSLASQVQAIAQAMNAAWGRLK